jgi:translation elongation factor EF-4
LICQSKTVRPIDFCIAGDYLGAQMNDLEKRILVLKRKSAYSDGRYSLNAELPLNDELSDLFDDVIIPSQGFDSAFWFDIKATPELFEKLFDYAMKYARMIAFQ